MISRLDATISADSQDFRVDAKRQDKGDGLRIAAARGPAGCGPAI